MVRVCVFERLVEKPCAPSLQLWKMVAGWLSEITVQLGLEVSAESQVSGRT